MLALPNPASFTLIKVELENFFSKIPRKMIYTKDSSTEDEEIDVSLFDSKTSQKRHRKHKHKKHKKRKLDTSKRRNEVQENAVQASSKQSINKSPNVAKGRTKYQDEEEKEMNVFKKKHEEAQSAIQKYVDKIGQGLGLVPVGGSSSASAKTSSNKKKKTQRKDSETSSEEERWLDAIQSGKLDEVDEELKKIKPKDPKLMTARQRAMLERKTDREPEEQLMSLPSGYKEVVMTAEAIQRKAIKSQKRKQMADEKREKDKKKTMERLLKKQDSKTIKSGAKKTCRKLTPQMVYINSVADTKILVPSGYQFPFSSSRAKEPPTRIKCAVESCENEKKYSCSKTGFPLCSLKCYKTNLLRIKNML